jgi:SpoVK/Ycf46/Vps4 family AAA+-type ATPase
VSGKAEANAAAARAGKPLPFPGEKGGGGGGGGGSRFKPPFAPAEAEGGAPDEKRGLLAKYAPPHGAPLPDHFLGVDLALAEAFASDSEFRGKDVDLADVAGLAHVKALLEQALTQPLLMPDLEAHSSLLQTPRALLLFGPPGTGKTMLARAVASKFGFSFFSISASSISSKWQGDSERNVKALWAVAQELAPSIIFLDEIDSLLTARRDGEAEAASKVKTEFLVQMDGANRKEVRGKLVMTIGATNRPDILDEAVRRRFTRRIHIPLPDLESRAALIERAFAAHKLPQDIPDAVRATVAAETEGYSSADLREICRAAAGAALNRWLAARAVKAAGGGSAGAGAGGGGFDAGTMDEPVTAEDLLRAMRQIRPSVSEEDVRRHKAFDDSFGWKGGV